MIKAVIFDVDGTMANSEHLHRRAFNILLKKYNLKIDKSLWQTQFIGTGSRHIAEWMIHHYHFPETVDSFVEKKQQLYQKLIAQHPVKSVVGFKRFFSKLENYGYKIIVASSGHHNNIVSTLHAIHIAHVPIVSINDVHFRKPHPQIFHIAAQRLGVKPLECIVFEDSVVGIEAAHRARMKVIALLTTTPKSILIKLKPYMMIKDYRAVDLNSCFFRKKV
ncbi:MAG: HAD family phosphatase [Candidatus Woesearchaeota archaeon]|jgi:HAD superfamily hydrolase (TIGR01509 family)